MCDKVNTKKIENEKIENEKIESEKNENVFVKNVSNDNGRCNPKGHVSFKDLVYEGSSISAALCRYA
jgi:hypothetical protein